MNKHIYKIVILTACCTLAGSGLAADKKYTTQKEKFSYALGVQIANSMKQQGITDVDSKVVGTAIADALKGGKLQLTVQEMTDALNTYKAELEKKHAAAASEAKAKGDKFRAENKKKAGVKETASGIQYEIITEGKGDKPKPTDKVTVNYKGTLVDGKEFDSSYKRGEPATFALNGVIKGWTEILQMMPAGSKWKVVIPPNLAYGETGAGAIIGPNETLVFEIELLSINNGK